MEGNQLSVADESLLTPEMIDAGWYMVRPGVYSRPIPIEERGRVSLEFLQGLLDKTEGTGKQLVWDTMERLGQAGQIAQAGRG